MKIAMIAHSNAPWTPLHASYFRSRAHDVVLISFHPDRLDGVKNIYAGRLPYRENRDRHLVFTRVPMIRRILREWKPDIVYASYLISNGLTAALSWSGPLVISGVGGDILDHPGGTPLPEAIRRFVMRYVCSRARRIHVVSDELADALRACGVPGEKIETFPVGVDLRRFYSTHRGPLPTEEPRLICTRRHEPVYGNDVIIDALARLREKGRRFRCTFVGGGSLLPERRRQAHAMGVSDVVDFTQHVKHDDVVALLQSSQIYISASSSDGTSASLLEALACGLFPVLSRIRANEPWIQHGRTGMFFEVGDSRDLAGVLERSLDDPGLIAGARNVNRALVERHGDLAVNNDRLLRMLSRAIEPQVMRPPG